MLSEYQQNRIHTLNVRTSANNSPALRLGLSKLLNSVDMRPSLMSPSAILLINRISENIPEEITELGKPNHRQKTRWEASFKKRIIAAQEQAIRPSSGELSSRANAVLFVDKTELLACLCRSVTQDKTDKQWWWQSYFAHEFNVSPVELSVRQILKSPQLIPSVLNLLIDWKCGTGFIRMLDKSYISQVTIAMLKECNLTSLGRALDSEGDPEFAAPTFPIQTGNNERAFDEEKSLTTQLDADPEIVVPTIISKSPWKLLLEGNLTETSLSRDELFLLGIARMLHKSPLALQKKTLQADIVRWWYENPTLEKPTNSHASSIKESIKDHDKFIQQNRKPVNDSFDVDKNAELHQIEFEAPPRPTRAEHLRDEIRSTESRSDRKSNTLITKMQSHEKGETNTDSPDAENESGKTGNITRHNPHIENQELYTPSSQNEVSGIASLIDSVEGQTPENDDVIQHVDASKSSSNDRALISGSAFEHEALLANEQYLTGLGGIFYLINLIAQIDLQDCISTHDRSGQSISNWSLLDATARSLLDTQYASFKGDPIWQIFAALDERDQETDLGETFQMTRHYRMPKKWFEFIYNNEQTIFWACENNRLSAWLDEGVLFEREMIDSSELENQLTTELAYFFPEETASRIVESDYFNAPKDKTKKLEQLGITNELTEFFSLVVPAIRRYLQIILELKSVDPKAILNNLLACDAQIFIGGCHIDMVADVENTSFEIRCSGLDQDPGWLPDYGRVVLFHFSNT